MSYFVPIDTPTGPSQTGKRTADQPQSRPGGPPAPKGQRTELLTLPAGTAAEPIVTGLIPAATAGNAETLAPAPSSRGTSYWQKRKTNKIIVLASPLKVDDWVAQAEAMAQATGCLAELTTRFDAESLPGFDAKQRTPQAWICETRLATAWRTLHETISGSVWGYMRIQGYAKLSRVKKGGRPVSSPMPIDAVTFAQAAARRMKTVNSSEQTQEERLVMLEELHNSSWKDYPTRFHWNASRAWLKDILESCARQGNTEIAHKLWGEVKRKAVGAQQPSANPALTPDTNVSSIMYPSNWSRLRPDGHQQQAADSFKSRG